MNVTMSTVNENITSWTVESFNVTRNITARGSHNEQSREEYIGNMMNIIGRPILIVFGTAGKNQYLMYFLCSIFTFESFF